MTGTDHVAGSPAHRSPALRDVLESIRAGALPPPPAASLLGLEIVEIGDGTAVFDLTPAPEHLNATGTVNGGLLATLADFAVCCAVSDVPVTSLVSTAGLHVTYQRAVTLDTGRVLASARVLHRTARTATVEAPITDTGGRLHAQATVVVRAGNLVSRRPAAPPPPAPPSGCASDGRAGCDGPPR